MTSGDQSSDEDLIGLIDDLFAIGHTDDATIYDSEGLSHVMLTYKFMHKRILESDDLNHEVLENTWEVEVANLVEIRNRIADNRDKWDRVAEDSRDNLNIDKTDSIREFATIIDRFFQVDSSDDMLLFYTLADQIIQGIAGDLLHDVCFDRREKSKQYCRSINRRTQEDLLYHAGEINNGTKSELSNIRQTRNRLVHEVQQSNYLVGHQDILAQVDRSLRAIDEFHEKVHNRSPVEGLPD